MPTVPRRPAAQPERDRLQARRLPAAELFAARVHQAEVAGQLGVFAQAVSGWHACWEEGGSGALHSRGPSGPAPRLSDQQLAKVEQALLEGATANGFTGQLWTLERIALMIWRLTGVRHHPAWMWALLHHRLGWSVQRPVRRAAERDQDAIHRWVKEHWPAIKANAQRRRACLVLFDERALSLTPNVLRTWEPRGRPPTLTHPFNWKKASMAVAICYGVRGGGAQLAFQITPGSYDTNRLIQVLGGLQSSWVGRRRPCCGTDCPPTAAARCRPGCIASGPGWWLSRTPHLAYSFLRHAGLSVA